MDIAEFTNRLARVNRFNVEVSSANNLLAAGNGMVEIEYSSTGSITWREKGRWDHRLNFLQFTNVYRWSTNYEARLGLEHLRYGDEHPVQLVELEKTSHDVWGCISPHICGQDRYQLTLSVNANEVIMVWYIQGPDKNQISTVRYT